jgi:hypothetical protein
MIFELSDEQRARLVSAIPDPITVLDIIERVNELGDWECTIRGTWDRGQASAGPTEPE